jgi:hypothetical protein
MKRCLLFIIAAVPLLLTACGDELPPSPQAALPVVRPKTAPQQPKAEEPRYAYHGDSRRDPFIALNLTGGGSVSSEDVVMPNLSALMLKGIFDDGKGTAAIISGGGITYILRDRKLYDNRQRLVSGVSGEIRKESIVLVGPDRIAKELKLREK